jgi:hypothetical protein
MYFKYCLNLINLITKVNLINLITKVRITAKKVRMRLDLIRSYSINLVLNS